MTDQNTTLADVRAIVRQFVDARDWQQFHSPKNLSMALAIEAAELMEHFQWITPEASRAIGERGRQVGASRRRAGGCDLLRPGAGQRIESGCQRHLAE